MPPMTTIQRRIRNKFKSLVGDAIQLTQQNRRASRDFMHGLLGKKVQRKKTFQQAALMKKIPKLSELVSTLQDKVRTVSCRRIGPEGTTAVE
ncbi:hypothetical protein PoB_000830100 [Plakobranchus ocellatus]|uniref:Uncharacterized protein n=1 Tax=Plakobranchus ocellatus TaxID=259542 RepID=A0AAV3YF18_9GAST|nr:hypothetical protein PoB_000830100 [Plakobranchus ocellatus]